MLQQQLEQILQANNWEARYRLLMKLGTAENLPFDEHHKIDEHLVSGCESKVWLTYKSVEGKHIIQATSDSKIVRGLLVIILNEMNLLGLDRFNLTDSLSKYQLANHLSESRSNGLAQIYRDILDKSQQNT